MLGNSKVTFSVVVTDKKSIYLRVAFDSCGVRFTFFLVKVYFPLCKMFLNFKSNFEKIYL